MFLRFRSESGFTLNFPEFTQYHIISYHVHTTLNQKNVLLKKNTSALKKLFTAVWAPMSIFPESFSVSEETTGVGFTGIKEKETCLALRDQQSLCASVNGEEKGGRYRREARGKKQYWAEN